MTRGIDNFVAEASRIIAAHDRLKCGARTRKGTPCRAPGNGAGGRCKLHGGKSTGPRTKKGKEAARLAVVRRWSRYRAEPV